MKKKKMAKIKARNPKSYGAKAEPSILEASPVRYVAVAYKTDSIADRMAQKKHIIIDTMGQA